MDRIVGHENLAPGAWAGGAVTVGVFDGVHLGHRDVLARTCERAGETGGPAVVITFDRHPQLTVSGSGPVQIVPLDYRLDLIADIGLDRCLVLVFDEALAARTADWFVEDLLITRIGASAVVLGYDCRFGHGGAGDASFVAANEARFGLPVESVGPTQSKGVKVSSTVVRRAITDGNLDLAAELLGRPVTIRGPVIRGDGRGRQLGFPTANIDHAGFLLPPGGVYVARATVDGQTRDAMVNIGTRPTFEDASRVWLEAFLVDFDADVYDRVMTLELVRKIRDEQRFSGPDELVAQIRRDLQALMES